jgi:hypothetical protein
MMKASMKRKGDDDDEDDDGDDDDDNDDDDDYNDDDDDDDGDDDDDNDDDDDDDDVFSRRIRISQKIIRQLQLYYHQEEKLCVKDISLSQLSIPKDCFTPSSSKSPRPFSTQLRFLKFEKCPVALKADIINNLVGCTKAAEKKQKNLLRLFFEKIPSIDLADIAGDLILWFFVF